MTTHKHFYAAHSYMGLNYTYNSPCWMVYAFDGASERDAWLERNEYNQDTGNYVAEKCSAATASKIAPELRTKDIHARRDCDRPWRVEHWCPRDEEWCEQCQSYCGGTH